MITPTTGNATETEEEARERKEKARRAGWFREQYPNSRWDYYGQWIGHDRKRKREKALATDPHCSVCGCELTLECKAPNQMTLVDGVRYCRNCSRKKQGKQQEIAALQKRLEALTAELEAEMADQTSN